MRKHQMYDFLDTPPDRRKVERDMTLTIIVAGLQRVIRGEHSHDEQERIIKNAATLLADLSTQYGVPR